MVGLFDKFAIIIITVMMSSGSIKVGFSVMVVSVVVGVLMVD